MNTRADATGNYLEPHPTKLSFFHNSARFLENKRKKEYKKVNQKKSVSNEIRSNSFGL